MNLLSPWSIKLSFDWLKTSLKNSSVNKTKNFSLKSSTVRVVKFPPDHLSNNLGLIDVGDGCWNPNALVTSLRCW